MNLYFFAGAPCNGFKGFCDVFQICRDVDADGPLARLKDFLLNTQTLNEVVNWITVRVRHVFLSVQRSIFMWRFKYNMNCKYFSYIICTWHFKYNVNWSYFYEIIFTWCSKYNVNSFYFYYNIGIQCSCRESFNIFCMCKIV